MELIRRIAPEAIPLITIRYDIMQKLRFSQPLGRRTLARRLDLGERIVRRELDLLRRQGLVEIHREGVCLTETGMELLHPLGELVHGLKGLDALEKALARALNLRKMIIVPGDSDESPVVKQALARATSNYLAGALSDDDILAVTGGTTLAEVARSLPDVPFRRRVTVVPARGGLGEEVELQANTIAATIARHLGGSYRLFHIPDDLPREAIDTICSEPKIRQIMDLLQRADYVLHGIGTAEEMAKRRGLDREQMAVLRERRAVGEAFGYYFDQRGRIVYSTSSAGLRLEDLPRVGEVIAVSGGRSKAQATLAVLSTHYQDVCITDEGAARLMWSLLGMEG
ncbi:MAG: sugar-binding transcriptional regulator [Limnochordia bacterium]|jgi:central glycolytic genes regulator